MARKSTHVERELYIAAPDGIAVYAQNPSYTSVEGQALIEAIKHEAMHIDPDRRERFYHPRIFRRRSEDGGRTWVVEPDLTRESPSHLDGQQRHVPMHILDPNRNVLICLHATYEVDTREGMFERGNRMQRTYRTYYELSHDGGRSWSDPKQVIDSRDAYDAVRWGPGLSYGQSGGAADMLAWAFLDDGTLVFGLTVGNASAEEKGSHGGEKRGRWAVVYVQARWDDEAADLRFIFGNLILVDPGQSRIGCCEPALAWLGGRRLFNAMRCQGDEASGLYATRFSTVSEDGGLTWSKPEPLRYDDGSVVWTPASFSQFLRSSRKSKTYWLANILSGPVHGQTPRYPLTIAEFDTGRCCILKNTVQVIQNLPEGAPKERRYTNWGSYEERGTGDIILTLPEQPKYMDFSTMARPEDFTADCLRYRVQL